MSNYPFNSFYNVVEQNIKEAPNRTIIFQDKLKISNKEFKKYIDQIAAYLIANNIHAGDKVAIVMSNCWQYIINIFAISKIGAVVVPINSFLKEDELAYILNDAQAKLLFSSSKFSNETKDLLSKTSITKIVWVGGCPNQNERNDDYTQLIYHEHYKIENPYPSQIDDIAYIMYTSGTTGKPKGAMLTFRNIFSNCAATQKLMNIKNGGIRMLAYLPMFHAFTLTATVMLPIYSNSGVIVITSICSKKDFKHLLTQLLLKRCPFFTGVPDVYSAMARAKLPWYFHWFHNVKGFISGAAPLPDEVYRRFTQSFKRGVLLQGYGISECSPVISCNTPTHNKFGSVGQPLTGYQVKIVDDNMQEVPIGEICVKGDNVMKGYYNHPEETKEAIIDGWFKTGDIGKVDEEGYIFILDRKKDLIIHKGMNIYPREIEEVFYTNQKINACAVIGERDKDGSETPVAYIELKEHESSSEKELKDYIKPHLATFKMPRKIYFMDKLPRNATGKILKRELRELHQKKF